MGLTQVNSEGIKDDSIVNADIKSDAAIAGSKLADNAVGLAQMASGTDGQIITYDASGDPIAVGPGTDGQVLTSTGAGSPPAFETPAAGVGGATGVDFNDSVKARFGTGNDLEIFHDGNDTYISDTGTGDLYLSSNKLKVNNGANDETMAIFNENGAVELFYDAVKKFETTSSGTTISTTNDSGSTTLKLENNSTANSTTPSVDIVADLASGKAGGSIQFVRHNTYQSSAGADSEVRINPAKNDANTESLRITNDYVRLSSGTTGLQFNGDTAAANALDDYEEGTWTPNFYYHTSLANISGHYTKIGRMVYAYFAGNFYSQSSSTQYISNLPFTSSNNSGGNGGIARGYQNWNIQYGPIYYIEPDTTKMWFYKENGVGMPASEGNGNSFRGIAIYHTDS